jgi:hypothetical protein
MFKDPAHQAFFAENGFIKLAWLDPQTIETLREAYYRLTAHTPDGFYTSYAIPDIEFRRQVKAAIVEAFRPALEKYFVDVQPMLVSFITKTKGDPSKDYISAHQDWSFVDETLGYTSINIWCPLEPTGDHNGNLCFVPRSNQLARYPRQAEDCQNPYLPYYDMMAPYAVHMPTELGEALLFNNATFHFSTRNTTDSDRLVAGMMEARMAMYYENRENPALLDVYTTTSDYFVLKPFGARPDDFVATIPKPIIEDPVREILTVYPDAVPPPAATVEAPPTAPMAAPTDPPSFWQRLRNRLGLSSGQR